MSGKIATSSLALIEFISKHPNEFTYEQLAEMFPLSDASIRSIVHRNQRAHNLQVKPKGTNIQDVFKKRLNKDLIAPAPNHTNILAIGDLHEPFTLDEYLGFCLETYNKYECNHVIFMGDVVDNHFSSYHETNPDGFGGGEELDRAIDRIARWVKAFPKADVCIGNHDRIIMRKAFTGGIPSRWIRDYQDVLEAPGWSFKEDFLYDGVHYIHGENGTARSKAKKDLSSTVQGHRHQEAYTEYFVGQTFKIFGMQVGCGIDRKSYAMAYAKAGSKPAIGVGVILNHGTLAFNVLMEL